MTNGTCAVIDVGSNSVRLMLSRNGVTLLKRVKVTKLAEGVANNSRLSATAIERTANAVNEFYIYAKSVGAEKVFVFATAGVRQAQNGAEFTDKVKDLCGLTVDVVSGEKEALLGAVGALYNTDGGVIDIGGASTEIIVLKDGNVLYSKSLDVGAVRLYDMFKDDKVRLSEYVKNKVTEFGNIGCSNFVAIGGTATSVASVLQKLQPYDPTKVDGFRLEKKDVCELSDKLFDMSVEERRKLQGLQPERAEIIASGVALLKFLMQYLRIDFLNVSEKDNLEGYLTFVSEKL